VSAFWQTDDGWPYADGGRELADPAGEPDEDLLSVRLPPGHLLDHLDPTEREVIAARYGLGRPSRSIEQLQADLGMPHAELRAVLGSGLAKLRAELSDPPLP
jgi:DNA-directed RNA polymerase specialized sigma24 family protein